MTSASGHSGNYCADVGSSARALRSTVLALHLLDCVPLFVSNRLSAAPHILVVAAHNFGIDRGRQPAGDTVFYVCDNTLDIRFVARKSYNTQLKFFDSLVVFFASQ